MSEHPTLKGFGHKFEEKVPQAILGDENFGHQIMDILEPSCFDLRYVQEITRIIVEYYSKYETFPTADLLESICIQDIDNPMLKKECLAYLEKIKTNPLNGDSQYIKDNSLKFFKTQHLKKKLLNDVLPRIQDANFEDIVPIIQEAVYKGTDRNVGLDYSSDEKRFLELPEDKVATPWDYLNKLLNGGWAEKRLVTFIGATGAGKSHFLVDCGAYALSQGKTIVHYTLELSEIDVARRYDAYLTDTEINNVPQFKDKVIYALKQKIPPEAKLFIKEYPMKQASIQTIKSHLSMLRVNGIIPDLILIDYGDLLKPVDAHEIKRHGLEANWIDMKSLAQELKIPVLTVTQANRSGYNTEVLLPDQVAEDFSKIMHSDIIITMARNMAQKIAGCGKMYMAKNRQGHDGQIFSYKIDTSKSKIEMFELLMDPGEELEEKLEPGSTADKIAKFLQKKN